MPYGCPRFRPGANDSKSLSTSQAAELERRFNRCRFAVGEGEKVAEKKAKETKLKHGAPKVGYGWNIIF